MTAVLDASTVLALINNEPGWEVASSYLDDAVVSAVNLAEVVGKLRGIGLPPSATGSIADLLALVVVPFDEAQAVIAGDLVAETKSAGLSLGDRCCLALAKSRDLVAVTADRAWLELEVDIEIVAIRP
ncbi:MAG: type II toxin-antitoxin system VapC family toxin [Acidimicrobiia bacterium]|nr:type II toxin-antitoxin system VapC family toxin [Acidimicrobiia bacterium]NNF08916.1 type II toxin-antitoxin system VapC family toxin [Acidimicrobiia bacterium]NNL14067.1 type II toxin-antitoxin system VapC family toxin [Acidimicrobiia bacterium]NNL99009.1 type II toxin-antitoxin system VapC family toxin [Acidimicrobiia bacterium]RZV43176.1 MAG: PIN domain-containing protein [Acidimicrobiia bacterium]